MSKNIELMESAIESNNRLLVTKLKLEEGWTDEEVLSLCQDKLHKVFPVLKSSGKLYTVDEIEEWLGDDVYDD